MTRPKRPRLTYGSPAWRARQVERRIAMRWLRLAARLDALRDRRLDARLQALLAAPPHDEKVIPAGPAPP